jgi:hypothetical protein
MQDKRHNTHAQRTMVRMRTIHVRCGCICSSYARKHVHMHTEDRGGQHRRIYKVSGCAVTGIHCTRVLAAPRCTRTIVLPNLVTGQCCMARSLRETGLKHSSTSSTNHSGRSDYCAFDHTLSALIVARQYMIKKKHTCCLSLYQLRAWYTCDLIYSALRFFTACFHSMPINE